MGQQETFIHPTSLVDPKAELGQGVFVGPFCVIGSKVKLADHVKLDSHVVVQGRTTIGEGTRAWPFASIGTSPQDLKYRGEDSVLEVGCRNLIREYVNLSIGTDDGGGITRIGDDNLFMVNTHVAHDCVVGDGCIFANGVSLAGHVTVEDNVVLGGHTAVHQFCRLGQLSMLAGGSIVVQDVVPFVMVQGDRAKPNGVNLLGLRRAGVAKEEISQIKQAYKEIFRSQKNLDDAVESLASLEEIFPGTQKIIDFARAKTLRGYCR